MNHVVAWGHGVGMFSMITQVITVLDEFHDKDVVVNWNSNTLYWEPTGWNGVRHNVWEYYFEPTSETNFKSLMRGPYNTHQLNHYNAHDNKWEYVAKGYVADPATLEFDNLTCEQAHKMVDNDVFITQMHANHRTGWGGGGWVESDRQHLKDIIDSHIHVKPVISAKVDAFYNKHMAGRKVVGIHFRGTDKHTELHNINGYDGKGVRPVGEYLRVLDAVDKRALVYLATDCQTTFDAARLYLGTRLLSHDNWLRSTNDTNPYLKSHKSNKALHGEQVIIDWLLLARCNFFIHGFSNLSAAVSFMNPTQPHFNVYQDRI